jgi:hypothetical protein
MNRHKLNVLLAGGFVAGSLIGSAVPARADSDWHRWWGHERRDEVRNDRREIQNDRKELRDDRGELRRDRRELRQDLRNGAGRRELANDRVEFQRDQRDQLEFHRDHR